MTLLLWLQPLMTDSRSPIVDFYPTDFRVDQEGKRNDWEGIVLVPFIDEARLLQVDGWQSQGTVVEAIKWAGLAYIWSMRPSS